MCSVATVKQLYFRRIFHRNKRQRLHSISWHTTANWAIFKHHFIRLFTRFWTNGNIWRRCIWTNRNSDCHRRWSRSCLSLRIRTSEQAHCYLIPHTCPHIPNADAVTNSNTTYLIVMTEVNTSFATCPQSCMNTCDVWAEIKSNSAQFIQQCC